MIAYTPGATVSIGATTTSSAVSCGTGQKRFYNAGIVTTFLTFGTSTVTATTTGYPLTAGTIEWLNIGANTYAAGICSTAGGTATVYVTNM